MSQAPSETIQALIDQETTLLAQKARLAEAVSQTDEQLKAVRNQLNGVKLGQQLAEEIAHQATVNVQ